MKTKKRNSSLKFICAIAMSLFSLIALFAGTLAWFSSVRITHNAANNFDVDNSSLMVKSISIHNQVNNSSPYIFKTDPAVKYDIVKDKVQYATGYTDASLENISIRAYSSLSEYPDSTLLYLFEIDSARAGSAEESFNIKIKTDTPNTAAAGANNTNGSLVYKDSNGLAHKLVYDVTPAQKTSMQNEMPSLTDDYFGLNSMSSTISFDTKGYTSLSTTTVSNTSCYNLSGDYTATALTNNTFSRQSFVTITGTNTQTGDATYNYVNDINAYSREVGSSVTCPAYVAIVCHYNADALQYIFNVNLGNPVADSEEVYFTCDWYFEIR